MYFFFISKKIQYLCKNNKSDKNVFRFFSFIKFFFNSSSHFKHLKLLLLKYFYKYFYKNICFSKIYKKYYNSKFLNVLFFIDYPKINRNLLLILYLIYISFYFAVKKAKYCSFSYDILNFNLSLIYLKCCFKTAEIGLFGTNIFDCNLYF